MADTIKIENIVYDVIVEGNDLTIVEETVTTVNPDASIEIPAILSSISDVNISTPTDGQAIVYDDGIWVNSSVIGPAGATGATGPAGSDGATGPIGIGTTGATGPQGLTGVTGPQGATGPAGAITGLNLGSLSDVTLDYPTELDFLYYNGSYWANGQVQLANNVNGVTITNPTDGQALVYDDGTAQWVNSSVIGPAGPTGSTGATGPAGSNGVTGPQGITGATGPAGADGIIGVDGSTGPIGVTGATGPAGPVAGSTTELIFNNAGNPDGAENLTYVGGNLVIAAGAKIVFS